MPLWYGGIGGPRSNGGAVGEVAVEEEEKKPAGKLAEELLQAIRLAGADLSCRGTQTRRGVCAGKEVAKKIQSSAAVGALLGTALIFADAS